MRSAAIIFVCFTPATALSTQAALAARPMKGDTYNACLDKAGGVDPAIRDCEDAELGRQDAALNQTYNRSWPCSARTASPF